MAMRAMFRALLVCEVEPLRKAAREALKGILTLYPHQRNKKAWDALIGEKSATLQVNMPDPRWRPPSTELALSGICDCAICDAMRLIHPWKPNLEEMCMLKANVRSKQRKAPLPSEIDRSPNNRSESLELSPEGDASEEHW
jgi:hypothetical protein